MKNMEKTDLRVLSYNIHKGFSSNNRKFILDRIRDSIREIHPFHPDIIFLQEVLGHHESHRQTIENWPAQPQFEYLAHEIWPHFTYGKNAVYTSGHHGNAILSKHPLTFSENIDISTNRLERRGLLHGVIHNPAYSYPIHAICVHLGLLEAERMTQVQRICSRIESHVPHSEPLLIAGDFNDWLVRASRTLQSQLDVSEAFLTLHNTHAKTFPSWLPALRLDRVYYRGLKVKKAKCLTGKPWSELSDHAALYVEFGESPSKK